MDYRRLIERSREAPFEVHAERTHTLVLRRPSDTQFLFRYAKLTPDEQSERLALDCVVDWDFTGADLAPGVGGEDKVRFDAATWAEWVSDRPEVLLAVALELYSRISAHRQAKAEAAGIPATDKTPAVPGKSPST